MAGQAVMGKKNPAFRPKMLAEPASAVPGGFELMHPVLDSVWDALFRVLQEGGIACINIGDTTRTGKEFKTDPEKRLRNYLEIIAPVV